MIEHLQLIKRDSCMITNTNELEHLYTFKNFPIFMGAVRHDIKDDVFADMSWVISKNSGIIQLENLIPLHTLYSESHGAGTIGKLWNAHHQSFANFISQFNPSSIFEIGGGNGILSGIYNGQSLSWTILDPNPSANLNNKARFITGFFNEDFNYDDSFDAVVHSHVFEHIYYPHNFMGHLSHFIAEGKYLIFSIPNLIEMLRRKYTNTINFEHTIFLTEPYIEFLLSKYGFRLLKKEYFMEDHSVFYATIKDNSVKINELYQEYISHHKKFIDILNYYMSTYQQKAYLFGAHIFTQYLIGFGINTNNIISILDNDKNKQGKRLYGTSLMVNSTEILRKDEYPIVVVSASAYNEEIKNDILENINPNTIFWE
jgi:hypothetical protein